ncbi:probably inactive leucine-rich repeat receptor-like protein kinase IMK2, partial [Tanacetum coccineum]
ATLEKDVYSLGLIMLELLTGKSVLKEEWTMEIFDHEIISPKGRLKVDEVLMQPEENGGTRKARTYYSTKSTKKQPEADVEKRSKSLEQPADAMRRVS